MHLVEADHECPVNHSAVVVDTHGEGGDRQREDGELYAL